MRLSPGDQLRNRYRIEETIAQGGMGTIYRAIDETLGIVAAIKENLATNEDAAAQFHREANILAGVRHPNLPRVTDHFSIPEQGQYLVMDYIPGEDLRERIDRQGPISEEEAITMAVDVCDALDYLHHSRPPIVHRDIKPGNIKITPEGQVYLVDFGLAKIAASGQATTTGAQALTPGYAPPEQYGQGTNPLSDIYALGATLYAALTGKIPEDGLSRMLNTASLTSLRKINPNISQKAADAIEKAMSVEPGRRFQSAGEFKSALLGTNPELAKKFSETIRLEHVEGFPLQLGHVDEPPVENNSVPLKAQKKKLPIIPVFIGLIVVGIILSIIIGLSPSSPTIRPTTATITASLLPTNTNLAASPTAATTEAAAVIPTMPQTETATQTAETISAAPTISATPTGGGDGMIAFASDRSGVPQVWIMNADGSQPVQVTNFPDGACQPDWSPDGNQLVFISPCPGRQDIYKNASMFIINTDGSGLTPLVSLPGGDFEPDWSPDGKYILFTSLRERLQHIFLYELAVQQVTRLSPPTTNDRNPAWAPDGQKIIFETTRLGESQIWIMNPDGSAPKEFSAQDGNGDRMPVWSTDQAVIYFVQGSDLPRLIAKQSNKNQAEEFPVAETLRPVYDPSVSPDSWWIAFEGIVNKNSDIFLLTRNGGNLTQLTFEPGADFDPAWKPGIIP